MKDKICPTHKCGICGKQFSHFLGIIVKFGKGIEPCDCESERYFCSKECFEHYCKNYYFQMPNVETKTK